MPNYEIDQRSLEIIAAMQNHRERLGKASLPCPEIDIGFLIQKIAGLQLAIEQLAASKVTSEPRIPSCLEVPMSL